MTKTRWVGKRELVAGKLLSNLGVDDDRNRTTKNRQQEANTVGSRRGHDDLGIRRVGRPAVETAGVDTLVINDTSSCVGRLHRGVRARREERGSRI